VDALPRHSLPMAELDSLASGRFSWEAINTLLSVERSRRLLLLRTVRDYARRRSNAAGPLSPVDDAWRLLLRAENADREVIEEILANPQVGTWVGHVLRRMRKVTTDDAPLWFHVGQLHCLAIAAVIRTGVTAELRVPVWNGSVMIPSLGHVQFPSGAGWNHAEVIVDGIAEVRYADTVIKLAPGSDGWFPTTRFQLGTTLSILLDHTTPYRGPNNPVCPEPMLPADVARWHQLLTEAWALLVEGHPARADELAIGMKSITPIPAAFRFRPRSVSVEDGFGAAILSEPYDAAQLAVTLIHEFQHSVLNGIRHVTELVEGEDLATCYAPWRDDPRPLGGLLHGVFAFVAIAEFWAVHRDMTKGSDADLANFEFALWRRQLSTVLDAIRNDQALTETGSRFLARIGERVDLLNTLQVPPEIAVLADTAARDHVAAWRACHLRPDEDWVRALADAWMSGRPVPPGTAEPMVQADRSGHRLDAKAALMRVKLTDSKLFDRIRAEPGLVAGASAADVAYVAGDFETAHRSYLDELMATPNRAGAWSGLGITMAAMGETDNADIILREPHMLRAMTAMLAGSGRPTPDELASWLSQKQDRL
jgi:HEXXH motif-containing protein